MSKKNQQPRDHQQMHRKFHRMLILTLLSFSLAATVVGMEREESIFCPPGVERWHGASPDQPGTQFNIARGRTTFLGEVSEKDFHVEPRPFVRDGSSNR